MIHLHNWSRWDDIERGKISFRKDEHKEKVFFYLIQIKECSKCGEKKLKKRHTN